MTGRRRAVKHSLRTTAAACQILIYLKGQ